MVQISTNPRKRRRFLENEFYAKDARHWVGKIKSADRMDYDQPIDRKAREELHPKTELIDLRSSVTKPLYPQCQRSGLVNRVRGLDSSKRHQ